VLAANCKKTQTYTHGEKKMNVKDNKNRQKLLK